MFNVKAKGWVAFLRVVEIVRRLPFRRVRLVEPTLPLLGMIKPSFQSIFTTGFQGSIRIICINR